MTYVMVRGGCSNEKDPNVAPWLWSYQNSGCIKFHYQVTQHVKPPKIILQHLDGCLLPGPWGCWGFHAGFGVANAERMGPGIFPNGLLGLRFISFTFVCLVWLSFSTLCKHSDKHKFFTCCWKANLDRPIFPWTVRAGQGKRSSYQHFVYAAVDMAKLCFGPTWPLRVMITDYQIVDRVFPWVDMGQPNLIAVWLQHDCHWTHPPPLMTLYPRCSFFENWVILTPFSLHFQIYKYERDPTGMYPFCATALGFCWALDHFLQTAERVPCPWNN